MVVAAENGQLSWRPCAMPGSRQMSSLTFVNNIISKNPFVRSPGANFVVFLYNLALKKRFTVASLAMNVVPKKKTHVNFVFKKPTLG